MKLLYNYYNYVMIEWDDEVVLEKSFCFKIYRSIMKYFVMIRCIQSLNIDISRM